MRTEIRLEETLIITSKMQLKKKSGNRSRKRGRFFIPNWECSKNTTQQIATFPITPHVFATPYFNINLINFSMWANGEYIPFLQTC